MRINSRFAKVAVASGLVVATGAGVLGITGFASAQVARESSAVATVVDSVVADGTTDSSNLGTLEAEGSVSAGSAGEATGVIGESWVIGETPGRPQFMSAAAGVLGMSESDLIKELIAGKSIKQVAEEKNVDLDKVTAAMTAALKTHLDEEVAAGEHTQAEADAKLAEFKTRVTEMVNRTGLPRHGGRDGHGGRGGHGPAKFATANLAQVLNLTEAEMKSQLKSGKSLAQIAEAQNVDIADVKEVLTSDFKAHLDKEVAAGEHTQAEADAKLAEFKTRLDDMVNRMRVPGDHEGGRGHGGRHGHGPMGQAPDQQGSGQAQGTSARL